MSVVLLMVPAPVTATISVTSASSRGGIGVEGGMGEDEGGFFFLWEPCSGRGSGET